MRRIAYPIAAAGCILAAFLLVLRFRAEGTDAIQPVREMRKVPPGEAIGAIPATPKALVGVDSVARMQGSRDGGVAGTVDAEPKEPASAIVQTILGDGDCAGRMRLAMDLPQTLGESDYKALGGYLLESQPGRDRDFRQHEYGLRNYIMDAMVADPGKVPQTIAMLSDIFHNERQGDIMRGYALQHLTAIYMQHAENVSAGDAARIIAVLHDAVGDATQGTLASTGLVGLREVSMMDASAVPESMVRREALALLRSDETGFMFRISALQICSEIHATEAIPFARRFAFDPEANWGLRTSAVYALGELGATRGMDTLLNDSDKHVRNAALAALGKRD